MDWSLYRTFLEVQRSGTLSGAARILGLTHPTVRRHIDELEEQLGGRLFTRSPSGLIPTELAGRILPEVTQIEASVATIGRSAAQDNCRVAGTVRLAASEMMGAWVLPPMLARVRKAWPGLTFELQISNTEADILRRDADLAIRMVRPRQGSLVAQRVGTIPVGLHAHRDWVDRHGAPASLDDLLDARCLVGPDKDLGLAGAIGIDPARLRRSLALATDSDVAQFAAIRAGLGVGAVQIPLAQQHRDLVRILPGLVHLMEVWLVVHPDSRSSAPLAAAKAALHAQLMAYVGQPESGTG